MMNKLILSLCISLVGVSACQGIKKEDVEKLETRTSITKGQVQFKKMTSALPLDITDSMPDEMSNDEYLFGKFFNDRVEFHIIVNPNLEIHQSVVNTLTLYYIDGYLCKKKYVLSNDISRSLILKHGRFKIKPMNQQTKNFIKFNPELILDKSNATLSDSLKQYHMSWEISNKTIRYRVEKDSINPLFEYVEEFPEYISLQKAVEFGVI